MPLRFTVHVCIVSFMHSSIGTVVVTLLCISQKSFQKCMQFVIIIVVTWLSFGVKRGKKSFSQLMVMVNMLNWIKSTNLLEPCIHWVTEHPCKALAVTVAVSSPVVNYWLKEKARRDLQ